MLPLELANKKILLVKEDPFLTDRSIYLAIIKYGETLLFRSDVVHCGGRPGVDLRKEATYYRLHFYLQTEFQMAPDNEVNKFHIDGTTSLTTLYRQTIEQKKKYSNKWSDLMCVIDILID